MDRQNAPNETFRIALAQINTTVGDLRGNSDKIIEYIKKAESMSVDMVVFPELAVTGYPPEDLLLKKGFIAANISEIKRIASNTGDIAAAVGFADQDDSIFNAAGILSSGKLIAVYRKIFLPNYGVFDEKRYFLQGSACPVFIIGGVRIGVNICEDIWFEDGPARWQAQEGKARILVNLSSSPYHMGKFSIRKKVLSMRARENMAFVAYNNLVGGQDELVFDGSSLVFNPDGKLVAMGPQFDEELIVVDLPIKNVHTGKKVSKISRSASGQRISALPAIGRYSDCSIKTHVIALSGKTGKAPLSVFKSTKRKRMSAMEEVYSALVLGLRDYAWKNGFKKGVIGLSGGIDSALTAAIAVDALGKGNVIGAAMPSSVSSRASVTDSELLSKNLGIKIEYVPISAILESYLTALKPFFKDTSEDTTEENIQARIRGNLIMALSNKFGWLPIATGNKSEISTGYCTLYGDMAGGFAVIKDVPKTMVYQLAEYRNIKAGFDLIPNAVIEKAPSAELRPNQKDTDSLPDYSALDPILLDYVEKDREVSSIVKRNGNTDTITRVIEMVDNNEYKRRQAPPGVKITPKAFGKDRRFPITNRFRG